MALRGVKPEAVSKRLKLLMYGPAGSGKTTAALQFPQPYFIDAEKGATNSQYVRHLKNSGGAYFQTADFDEMLAEVTSLLTEKHEYRTLVIDPLTVVYAELLDESAEALKTKEDPSGTAFGRHKGAADRKVKRLLNLLLRLDMNIIITSHSKTRWEKAGKEIVDAGQTFDCYTKLDYLLDLVVELQKIGSGDTVQRTAIVRKTRIEGFPDGDRFPWSYEEVRKRYGGDLLERASVAVELASADDVALLTRMVETLGTTQETVDKWLDKEGVESFAEMSAATIKHYIKSAQKKLQTLTPKEG